MKFNNIIISAFLASAAIPSIAYAQDAAAEAPAVEVTTGATIYGPDNEVVGTVEQVMDGLVVINTGTHSATLARDAFAPGENGPAIGYTKAQLDEAVAAAKAEADAQFAAALVPGAEIKASDGVTIGKVESVGEDGSVVVAREDGPIALSRNQLSLNDGALTLHVTSAQLESAINQQTDG